LTGFAAPSGAGALTQYFSWRVAFATSVPPATILIVLALYLPRGASADAGQESKPYGQLLCLAAAILVLSSASRLALFPAIACIAIAAALFAGFFWLDRRGSARILPRGAFSVLKMPGPGLWVIVLMPVTGAAGAVYFNYGVQGVMGLGPFNASLLQSLLAISWSCIAVWLAGIEAGWRERMLRLGAPLLISGYLLLVIAIYDGSMVLAGLAQVLTGLGFGMTWGPLSQLLMETAPDDERDRVSALLPSLQSMGYAIGGALFGIIAASVGIAENAAPAMMRQGLMVIFSTALIPAFAALFFSWRLPRR
jgi:predicted MFS family arabinose efflux permease